MDHTEEHENESVQEPPDSPEASFPPSSLTSSISAREASSIATSRRASTSNDLSIKKGYNRTASESSNRPGVSSVRMVPPESGRASVIAVIENTEKGIFSTTRKLSATVEPVAATVPTAAMTQITCTPSPDATKKSIIHRNGELRFECDEEGKSKGDEEDPQPHMQDQPSQSDIMTQSDITQSVFHSSLPTIEVVATPVVDDRKGGSKWKGRALAFMLVALGVIIGLTVGVLRKKKTSGDGAGLELDAEPDEAMGEARGWQVDIPPFRMELESNGALDVDGLLGITSSHLSNELQGVFFNFRSMQLTIEVDEMRHRRERLVRQLAESTKVSFEGSITFRGKKRPPKKSIIRSTRDAAFNGTKLNSWLVMANRDLGVTSVAVSDSVGWALGFADVGTGEIERDENDENELAAGNSGGDEGGKGDLANGGSEEDESGEGEKITVTTTTTPSSSVTTSEQGVVEGAKDSATELTVFQVSDPTLSPTPSLVSTSAHFLATPLRWKFSVGGAMFDVVNKGSQPVVVTSLDVHLQVINTDIPVAVWTRSGSHIGFEQIPGAWQQQNRGSPFIIPQGLGAGSLTPIPEKDFEPLTISPGARMGFYVALRRNKGMLMRGQRDDTVLVEDDHVVIEAGTSFNSDRFGDFVTGKMWNGAVRYIVSP
eukprot:CAMPEP_0197446848 /NCGR_PEP_ID=MMETSP1175-20131217/11678_1 /TAXON_ID=1003142 /ORGANISM="Triceratium dubium, Strain CCMP147" /LENGTH=655 /DNA_ID=CAMNT_0042978013 /DNA_START=248 /DNA_END=2215 /DNA_ORIENTATION=+